jgi:hypothetical protein
VEDLKLEYKNTVSNNKPEMAYAYSFTNERKVMRTRYQLYSDAIDSLILDKLEKEQRLLSEPQIKPRK